jgi:hypothetical protein
MAEGNLLLQILFVEGPKMSLLIHGGSMNVQALENEFDFIQPFRKHWLQALGFNRNHVGLGGRLLSESRVNLLRRCLFVSAGTLV